MIAPTVTISMEEYQRLKAAEERLKGLIKSELIQPCSKCGKPSMRGSDHCFQCAGRQLREWSEGMQAEKT